jgi:hypothetical protein
MQGLLVKVFGGISLGLVYQFYYGGGDTTNYFVFGSSKIYEAFLESPSIALKLIFGNNNIYDPETVPFLGSMLYTSDPHSYIIIRIAGLLGIFTFNSYYATTMLFAVISFSGSWVMFLTFYDMMPHLHKKFAIAVFFIPSVFFWGSGILKDSITLSALGWLFYGNYRMIKYKDWSFKTITIILISSYLIQLVKVYILMCYLPSLMIWLFFAYNDSIKSKISRAILKPLMLGIGIAAGLFAGDVITKDNEKYKLSNLTSTAKRTSEWLHYVSVKEGGSVYSLGDSFDDSFTGMLTKFPLAVNVTLFRPYIWESKNVVMFISSLESSYILIFTLLIIYRLGIYNTYMITRRNNILIFSFVFSFVFAYAVGISTNNFGTLARYKIPLIPFYLSSLYILESFISHFKKIKKETQISTLA